MSNSLFLCSFFIVIAVGGFLFGIFPFWASIIILFIPIIFLVWSFANDGLGVHGIETIIGLVMAGVFFIFMYPLISSLATSSSSLSINQQTTTTTITSNSTTTQETIISPFSASTTSWPSGINTIFTVMIILLPIVFILGTITHLFGIFGEDYRDDTGRVHIGRTYRQYGYDYNTEQSKFERDILDMDKIFRSET